MTAVKVAPAVGQNNDLIKPLTRTLKIGYYFGGFPYVVTQEEPAQLAIPKRFHISFCVTCLTFIVTYALYEATLYSYGLSSAQVLEFHRKKGFSQTDTISMVAGFFSLGIGTFALFWSHKNSAGSMTQVFKLIEKIPEPFLKPDQSVGALESSIWKAKLFIPLLTCGALSAMLATVSMLINLNDTWMFSAIVAFLQIILGFQSVTSPIPLVNFIIVDYISGLFVNIEKEFTIQLETATADDDLERLIDLGYFINEVKMKASECLSMKIMVIYVNGCLMSLFGIFFGTLILTAFGGDNGFNLTFFMNGLFYVFLTMVHEAKILSLVRKGQKMKATLRSSQQILEKKVYFHRQTSKKISPEVLDKISILMNHWQHSGFLRPMDAFNIDNASALSLYGTLLTYIIVLMQFKFGEK